MKKVLPFRVLFVFLIVFVFISTGQALAEDDDGEEDTTSAEVKKPMLSVDPPKPLSPPTPEDWRDLGRFQFGSYGRVQVTDDTKGHPGRDTNIVAHGPRIFEPSYGEIDLSYNIDAPDGFGTKILFTLALFEPLAHYSGEYEQTWAVRNMYAEAWGFVPYVPWIHIWAGSRMYRGDDIYLFDWWPLDNLNTIGGGLIFDRKWLDVRAHLGVNRLENDYQFQTIKIPGEGYSTSEKVVLDRQRWIASGKATYEWLNIYKNLGMKFSVYGEQHRLRSGDRIPPELLEDEVPQYDPDAIDEELPKEEGWVLGGQIGAFGFGKDSHANLFFRYAQDLAAYGETGVPYGVGNDHTSEGAFEYLVGLSAAYEFKWAGALLGGYIRKFKDADVNDLDTDDFVEGAFAIRPVIFITEHLHQGFELSYQQHYPFGIDSSSNKHEVSEVYQYSIIEIISLQRGIYKRPQFRLIYTLSEPNGSARKTYASGDKRRPKKTDNFVGFGVEWWFNSSSY